MEVDRSKDGRSVSRRVGKNATRKRRGSSAVLTEERLIEILKANKVEHYKTADMEIKFSPFAFLPNPETGPSSEGNHEDPDELLFYSAPRS